MDGSCQFISWKILSRSLEVDDLEVPLFQEPPIWVILGHGMPDCDGMPMDDYGCQTFWTQPLSFSIWNGTGDGWGMMANPTVNSTCRNYLTLGP